VHRYDVHTPSIKNECRSLSGGNQQKVIAARGVSATIKFLLANQPTRGLDVGSIEFIHSRIVEAAADNGCAVLFIVLNSMRL